MAAAVPTALKSADVQRFATRAAQLEKHRPIVSYWLEYHILQQVLSRNLHNTSSEAADYAVQLMDKLEQTKQAYATEPAVTDDVAAKAYMEQFASETFDRAQTEQSTDKVTRATADAFQASATFYDSLSIWGELDVESKAKSKFAKFHAVRIARALKEGKDPNETNPTVEVPVPAAADDDLEAELKQMQSDAAAQNVPAEASSTAQSAAADRTGSIDGGYFPDIPSTDQGHTASVVDFSTPHIDEETHVPQQPTAPSMMTSNIDSDTHIPVKSIPRQPTQQADPSQYYQSVSQPAAPLANITTGGYRTDDDAVMAAQKHAKWAISALNFEDVPTAVKELQIALQSLGAL